MFNDMSTEVVNASLHVLVIVASTRPGRLGPEIAEWFVKATHLEAVRDGITVDVADLADIGLPLLDEPEHPSSGVYVHEHTRAWSRRVAAADAFVVVTPEYNYGMPAALKNALDFLYDEWAWKPLGFVSYGNTSAASIPLALDEAWRGGKIKSGDVLLFVAFGGGLTWANAVVRV